MPALKVASRIVTGYVPIPGHPRTAAEYDELNLGFLDVEAPIQRFYNRVEDCWLPKFFGGSSPSHSEGDNPRKNTLGYHVVQHQKFEWLFQAAQQDQEADVFVWMDYGIFHQPGVTAAAINGFLQRLDDKKIYFPGCWPPGYYSDDSPCWRWLGSMIAVPREHVGDLAALFKHATQSNIVNTHNVTWEVNDFARLEPGLRHLPLQWYKADHNETQFTNFPGGR